MAITIKRGSTEEARREFICFVHAYQCMGLNSLDAPTVTLYTQDDDALPVFEAMEHNTVTDVKTGPAAIAAIMAA